MKKIFSTIISSPMKGRLCGLLFALLATTTLLAQTFQVGDLYYNITSSSAPYTVEVDDATSSITIAAIPETVTYNGTTYSVTSIGYAAFDGCYKLTSVTIPNSVTSIGEGAFYGCSSLSSVTIPNSVTSIGEWAFEECSSLTSVTLNSNDIVSKEYTSSSNIHGIFGSHVEEYVIGDSVTSIGSYAFYGCDSLTSVTIPNSVTSIGDDAFYRCSSLTSITIPNSVTSIGSSAFYNCSSLTSVTIGNSVTSIGEKAFCYCSSLTSVTIPNSVTSIGSYAFRDCIFTKDNFVNNSSLDAEENNYWGASIGDTEIDGLLIRNDTVIDCRRYVTSVIIPNSVTSIGSSAFYNCSSLTSITIPNSVTSIGGSAFSGCSSLTSITIPEGVTSIGSYAFANCSSLTSITIPNSVTSIGDWAFWDCSSLTSITIPNSVTSIGDWAFYGCSSLTSITIPNSVTSIGEAAFSKCSCLTSVIIGNSVTNIKKTTFWDCSSLSSVTIPNSVTSIGQWAFENCTSLNEITLPASVKSIDEEAFAGCTKLYDIYCFAMEPPTAYESSFANYNAFLHVPCDNQRVYLLDVLFGNFKYIECIEAETTPTDTVVVTPSFNDAEFIWPSNSSADSYTLAISKDGEVFCTLTFNANGQLTGIAFAPSRNGQHNTPAAAQTANGFAFTVTGLDEGSNYTYDLLIQDRSGNTLQSYSGEFRTQSTNDRTVTVEYDAAQGQVTGAGTYLVGDTVTLTAIPNDGYRFVRWSNEVEDNPYTFVILDNVTLSAEFEAVIHSDVENTIPSQQSDTHKLLRNGQLLILRDGKTYNIMGAEIK